MRTIYIFIILVSILFFTACTTEIELNLEGATSELVVDGSITTDTTSHTIKLYRTANYFANVAPQGISGAKVYVNDGFAQIELTEHPTQKGHYQTPNNYYGIPGRTYTLLIKNVDADGDGVMEEYSASCLLNSVPDIESMNVNWVEVMGDEMWAMRITMQDPENVKNYYMSRNYRNNVCVSDSIQEWGLTDDEFFDGVLLQDETFMYFSSTKEDEKIVKGDTLMIEICGITEEYLKFQWDARAEFWGRNPLFGGQPANIRSNIKQLLPTSAKTKPRGFFAAYSIKRATDVYTEEK